MDYSLLELGAADREARRRVAAEEWRREFMPPLPHDTDREVIVFSSQKIRVRRLVKKYLGQD